MQIQGGRENEKHWGKISQIFNYLEVDQPVTVASEILADHDAGLELGFEDIARVQEHRQNFAAIQNCADVARDKTIHVSMISMRRKIWSYPGCSQAETDSNSRVRNYQ